VDELDAKMKDAQAGKLEVYVYDNNEKARFDQGHIPGAKWVQFDNVKPEDLPRDKKATLVFYCANEH
jgi:3-mercaptopyruvate sulfurtransferase SseA